MFFCVFGRVFFIFVLNVQFRALFLLSTRSDGKQVGNYSSVRVGGSIAICGHGFSEVVFKNSQR